MAAQGWAPVLIVSPNSSHWVPVNFASWACWIGKKSVGEVFEYIGQYMPEPAPGTLSPQQTRDVVAFLLKSNMLPAGSTDLPDTLDAMKAIRMMK